MFVAAIGARSARGFGSPESSNSNFKQRGRQAPTLSRRDASELYRTLSLEKTEGAGKAGCPLHPQPRVQCVGSTRVSSPQVHRNNRPSLRNGFNGLFRAPRRRIRLVTVISGYGLSKPGRADFASANLTPATGGQDHTALPSATRLRQMDGLLASPAEALAKAEKKRRSSARSCIAHEPQKKAPCDNDCAPDAAASTASRPNVRDDRDTPLSRDGMAADIKVIWVRSEQEYFCERGWTPVSRNSPSRQISRVAQLKKVRASFLHPTPWVSSLLPQKVRIFAGANGLHISFSMASVFRSRALNGSGSMSAFGPRADSNHTPRHDRKVPIGDITFLPLQSPLG
jgi:hypothetical protein